MGFWGREGLRPRPDHKLGLGALESEGKLKRKRRKAKMKALHQAGGDVATPPLWQPEVLVSPFEAGASPSPAPLAACFLGTCLFLLKVEPLGKEAGGGPEH